MYWLVNYIADSKRKIVGGFKNKVVSRFKTNTPKQTVYWRGKKLGKPKTRKQSKENLFIQKKEKKEIRTLFEERD